ncbi:MAG: hypothetical protein RL077_6059 [Verrucomicrobiota bacterium]
MAAGSDNLGELGRGTAATDGRVAGASRGAACRWGPIIAGVSRRRGRPPDISGSRSQRFLKFLRQTRVHRLARRQPWGGWGVSAARSAGRGRLRGGAGRRGRWARPRRPVRSPRRRAGRSRRQTTLLAEARPRDRRVRLATRSRSDRSRPAGSSRWRGGGAPRHGFLDT